MFERIKHIVIKEFIQLFRDKRSVFFLFVTPVIQIHNVWLCGDL